MSSYKKLIVLEDFPARLAKPRKIADVQADELGPEVEARFQAALTYFCIDPTSGDSARDLALELLNRIAPMFSIAVERRGPKLKRTPLKQRQLLATAESLGPKARSPAGRKKLKAKASELGLKVGESSLDNLVSRGRKDRVLRRERLLHQRQLRREAMLRILQLTKPGIIGPTK